jgi:hypothetical protein
VQKLATVDGGIGYSDIATARANGYDIAPSPPGSSRDDDLFWTQTTDPNGAFREPTADPNGFRTDGLHGANCQNVAYQNVPASTLSDWNPVTGVDQTNGAWVVCTLTYDLAFDDYDGPYSLEGCGTSCEEQRARSVKDYMTSIVGDNGQDLLFNDDYAPLPDNILTISRAGVNSICWDKAGSGACPQVRYGFIRPKSAGPLRASLVPAFNQCQAASSNRQHGPPLGFPSCNPPTQSSGFLTVGEPTVNGQTANSVGFAKYTPVVGNPSTPANEADVAVTASITDVRNTGTLTDYTGQVQLVSDVTITDRFNGVAQNQPATTEPITVPVTVPCVATGSTTIGGTCSISTTLNSIVPNTVRESKRNVWALDQVKVNDGGADGVASTTPNTEFERQGVFIP